MKKYSKPIKLILVGFFVLPPLLFNGCNSDRQVSSKPKYIYAVNVELNEIVKYDLKKATKTILIDDRLGFPWRIVIDSQSQRMFWSNVDKNLVQSANIDGTDIRNLGVVSYPQGIALDSKHNTLFIAESGTPQLLGMHTDGSALDTLMDTGLSDPDNLIFDINTKRLYWIDFGEHAILSSDIDGLEVTAIIAAENQDPVAMDIDFNNKHIYWADGASRTIQRSNLDGSGSVEIVFQIQKVTSLKVQPDVNRIYWVDVQKQKIFSADGNGKQISQLVHDPDLGFHCDIFLTSQ